MSKLAKIPVLIEMGVTIDQEGQTLRVRGPKGELSFEIPTGIHVEKIATRLQVGLGLRKGAWGRLEKDNEKALLGLTRAHIANMIKGVSQGFEKELELVGVGYRASLVDNDLVLSVGFSHPVKVKAPAGITFSVSENILTIKGVDKELVGDIAAKIRTIRPPEPYKGKGIKYKDEKIRRKAGKAVKALGVK